MSRASNWTIVLARKGTLPAAGVALYFSTVSPNSSTSPAIEVKGLWKSYRVGHLRPKYRPALEDLTFEVERGEIFGFLGPNGAGKTTAIKVLLGLLRRGRGDVRILGLPHEDRSWRYRAGYLPEQPYFYDYLSPREYLDYVGALLAIPPGLRRERASRLLVDVGLEPSADQPLRRFSKGMLQRLGLAQALLNEPDIVFLDEPMSGLDPLGRRQVRLMILDLKRKGKTVFFSTHILSDAESLCDRVGLLRAGRLIKVGALAEILGMDVATLEVLVTGVDAAVLETTQGVQARRAVGERWTLDVAAGDLGGVIRAVEQAEGRVLSVQPVRKSLEDYFVEEMGGPQEGRWSPEDLA